MLFTKKKVGEDPMAVVSRFVEGRRKLFAQVMPELRSSSESFKISIL